MEQQMQDKLEQYRRQKRRKERFESLKRLAKNFLMLGTGIGTDNAKEETTILMPAAPSEPEKSTNNKILLSTKLSDIDEGDDSELASSDEETSRGQTDDTTPVELQEQNRWFKYALWTVYVAFWLTLYIIAIELKFGIVFLMFSALFFICINTRTGPKKKHEISAYSVFNKNCESIDGTLKAEQFEREIRYGPTSVR